MFDARVLTAWEFSNNYIVRLGLQHNTSGRLPDQLAYFTPGEWRTWSSRPVRAVAAGNDAHTVHTQSPRDLSLDSRNGIFKDLQGSEIRGSWPFPEGAGSKVRKPFFRMTFLLTDRDSLRCSLNHLRRIGAECTTGFDVWRRV